MTVGSSFNCNEFIDSHCLIMSGFVVVVAIMVIGSCRSVILVFFSAFAALCDEGYFLNGLLFLVVHVYRTYSYIYIYI